MSEHLDELLRNESFERTIGTFDANFSRLLLELLEKIMEFTASNVEVKLLNILHRYVLYEPQQDKTNKMVVLLRSS